ncbi:MAG: ribosome biogenesis GTPase Der [Gammaproteobacteria bacterium]
MKPVVAIVGRPNVGKSTLFNQLTRTRDALVADVPGLTRDFQFGHGQIGDRPYHVVDTGGVNEKTDVLSRQVSENALRMASEADAVIFVVDGKDGLTAQDETIAEELRKLGRPVHLAVNKTESLNDEIALGEFHVLGFGNPTAISSAHKHGLDELMQKVLADLPHVEEAPANKKHPRIAVLGRPNVGKSTLVNRMIGEERMLTFDMPGTTRDAVAIDFERDGKPYTLIDTAGVRRRARVDEGIEKFSVLKALQAIDDANVVIVVIDAREGVTDQDASLVGQVLKAGRALVIAVNKWDGMSVEQREQVRAGVDRRLDFIDFARIHYISALHGSGVGDMFQSIDRAYRSAFIEPPTSQLTQILENLLQAHQPPLVGGRRIKLRYAHLGGQNPPRIVIHGNQTESVPGAYKRYLDKGFREALKIEGTPLRVEFRTGENPFKQRRQQLTPRQVHSRRRLMRFAKKR